MEVKQKSSLIGDPHEVQSLDGEVTLTPLLERCSGPSRRWKTRKGFEELEIATQKRREGRNCAARAQAGA